MYEVEPDPYCYPGTEVLKNRAGLKTQGALERFETAMTFARAEEPLPRGRLSASHYRAIHRHLFQDVYAWAGKYRTVRISKGGNTFCYPEYISIEMDRLFGWLKGEGHLKELPLSSFAARAAHFLAELNAIHPFREGNGRTQLILLALVSQQAGHPLDFKKLDPAKTLRAMIESFSGKERAVARLIRDLAS